MWVCTSRALRAGAALLLAIVLTGTALLANAQGIRREIMSRAGYTEGQWALLPAWCRDTQDSPEAFRAGVSWDRNPNAQQWIALMGSDFQHMHHYCRGLRYELMLTSLVDLNPRERIALNERVIDEMEYIIKNCRPTMPLMPEAFLKKGEAHVRLNQLPDAQAAFEISRKLKPDYWPAYTRWAEVLIGLRQLEAARSLLEVGLSHAPNQPELVQMLRRAAGQARATAGSPAMQGQSTSAAKASAAGSAPASR